MSREATSPSLCGSSFPQAKPLWLIVVPHGYTNFWLAWYARSNWSCMHLLHNIGAEFLLWQFANTSTELKDQGLGKHWLVKIDCKLLELVNSIKLLLLTDILNNIVPKRILDKLNCMSCNLLNQLSSLVTRCMVDTTLKDTAAVTMCSHWDTVSANSIEDELCNVSTDFTALHSNNLTNLSILALEAVQTLLDDMVTVEILNQVDNLALKSMDDSGNLQTMSAKNTHVNIDGKRLTCSGVEMNSIIFCKALVPCWLRAILTRLGAAVLTRTVRWASLANSRSFWQR